MREKGVKGNYGFWPEQLTDGDSTYQYKEGYRRSWYVEEARVFGCSKFLMPVRHLSGIVEQAIRHGNLNFRRQVQARERNLGAWVGKRRDLRVEIWGL